MAKCMNVVGVSLLVGNPGPGPIETPPKSGAGCSRKAIFHYKVNCMSFSFWFERN